MGSRSGSSTPGRFEAGTVQEVLPNSMFRVRLESGAIILATPTRSATQVWTKFLPGDRVEVELSPYDPHRGRITARTDG